MVLFNPVTDSLVIIVFHSWHPTLQSGNSFQFARIFNLFTNQSQNIFLVQSSSQSPEEETSSISPFDFLSNNSWPTYDLIYRASQQIERKFEHKLVIKPFHVQTIWRLFSSVLLEIMTSHLT